MKKLKRRVFIRSIIDDLVCFIKNKPDVDIKILNDPKMKSEDLARAKKLSGIFKVKLPDAYITKMLPFYIDIYNREHSPEVGQWFVFAVSVRPKLLADQAFIEKLNDRSKRDFLELCLAPAQTKGIMPARDPAVAQP